MKLLKLIVSFGVSLPLVVQSQKLSTRVYNKGETFSYQLTTESFRNGMPDSRSVAVSLHTVLEDKGRLFEETRWLLKTVYSGNDTNRFDSIAQKVAPYRISLAPGGAVQLPPLQIPEMTGEITDLNTFYVAVSPSLHVHRLGKRLTFFLDSILHGKFADGHEIMNGEDRIEVSQQLIRQTGKYTIVETAFRPPSQLKITPLLDTIGKLTFDKPNNFQMVRKAANDKVHLLWGVEEFIITSTLDNHTGQILKAEMVNNLILRMRLNATKDLSDYEAEIPLTIKRVLRLELLK